MKQYIILTSLSYRKNLILHRKTNNVGYFTKASIDSVITEFTRFFYTLNFAKFSFKRSQ